MFDGSRHGVSGLMEGIKNVKKKKNSLFCFCPITLTPYEEVCLVSKLPQFIHLILKNLFFTLLDI